MNTGRLVKPLMVRVSRRLVQIHWSPGWIRSTAGGRLSALPCDLVTSMLAVDPPDHTRLGTAARREVRALGIVVTQLVTQWLRGGPGQE